MGTLILESTGNVLTIYEPPNSIEGLKWNGVSDEFKKEFLSDWQWAYKQEEGESSNGGIDTLSILSDLAELIESNQLDLSLSYEEAYQLEINKMLTRMNEED